MIEVGCSASRSTNNKNRLRYFLEKKERNEYIIEQEEETINHQARQKDWEHKQYHQASFEIWEAHVFSPEREHTKDELRKEFSAH